MAKVGANRTGTQERKQQQRPAKPSVILFFSAPRIAFYRIVILLILKNNGLEKVKIFNNRTPKKLKLLSEIVAITRLFTRLS